MELLPEGQKNQVQVLWEDQQRINAFSSFINEKDTLVEELEKAKQEKEYLDDLSMEIELLDESEKIQYKIGEVFVFIDGEKAVERIERDNEQISAKIGTIEAQVDAIDDKLSDLKTQLYAKFGSNINLER